MNKSDFSRFLIAVLSLAGCSLVQAQSTLTLQVKIPLGDVQGRIDHLAIDSTQHRLFVAELGNNSLGVVDLKDRRLIRTITTASEPQGVAFDTATDTLYVTSGGEGSVSLYGGSALELIKKITLGDDADNVRIDASTNQLWIGYGDGALAEIDLATKSKGKVVALRAHPEAFQLSADRRIFVNVSNSHEVAVIDRTAAKQITSWSMKNMKSNFAMALDEPGKKLLVAFRSPAKLAAISTDDGHFISEVDICHDADDVFIDSRRHRIYVVCGEGFIDVLESGTYSRVERVPTAIGARTGLFDSTLDQLFIAVRKSEKEPAAVWVFKLPSS